MDLNKIKLELKGRVAQGLNFGIEAFEEVIDHASPVYNDFILLKSKYNDLMHISGINTLPYDQVEMGLDRLRNNLLIIIDKLDSPAVKKDQVESDMKIQALPTRRTNFFKLLDIHFQNLEAITYVEVFGSWGNDRQENRYTGREAVFQFYQLHRRDFKGRYKEEEDEFEQIRAFFHKYFKNDRGMFEVYFNNIKHMLSYVIDSEIEKQFFLNTVKSLLSKYELATIFYYALSGLDPDFKTLIEKSGLIEPNLADILIEEEHLGYLPL